MSLERASPAPIFVGREPQRDARHDKSECRVGNHLRLPGNDASETWEIKGPTRQNQARNENAKAACDDWDTGELDEREVRIDFLLLGANKRKRSLPRRGGMFIATRAPLNECRWSAT